MNRAEFMSRLTALLQDVPPAEREEALTYYNEYFDDAGEENEAGVIAALGSPEELAKAIKAGLFDGGNGGEFTESGFHGYEQRNKNQLMSTSGPQSDAQGAGGTYQGDTQGNPQNGAQGSGEYGSYGQQANGAGSTYGSHGQQANGAGGAYGSYNQQANGAGGSYDSYSQQAGNGQRNGQGIPQKKPMTGGQIALIIVLAVLLSPVWIGVLGGLFGGGVGILAGLFGIFLAFLVVGVVLTVVGIALVIAGFVAMFGAPLGGLSMIGGGLVMVAVGLVFVWLMVLVVGTAIPALFRGCVNLCHRLFHKGGTQA